MLKSCTSCGLEFEAAERSRGACPACQTVKGLIKHYAGHPLSLREKQIIEFVRQGMANKEIAYRLQLTTGTISQYLVTIFIKCDVANRTNLGIWAERLAASRTKISFPIT